MHRRIWTALLAAGAVWAGMPTASAAPPLSGAIFTTDGSGVPVNLNIYDAKEDVHLNGGPGVNAPDGAAGLPEGTYSFQVTDPSGRNLLSTDDVACRQFTVAGGVITGALSTGSCAVHHQGTDGEDGGKTIQLMPFNDTPNNGGVYKVWVTPTSLLNCDAPGNKNCFVPANSKTDNFKVRNPLIVEIDTTFSRADSETYLDGMKTTWTDTNGATNVKYSEWAPEVLAFHEAHVEAAEQGWHKITVTDQPGCTVLQARGPDGKVWKPANGSLTVPVSVRSHKIGDATYFVRVECA